MVAADLRRRDRLGSLAVGVADDRQVVADTARAATGCSATDRSCARPRPATTGSSPGRSACCRRRRAPSRCTRAASCRRPRCSPAASAPAPWRRGTAARPSRPCPGEPSAARCASSADTCAVSSFASGFPLPASATARSDFRLTRLRHPPAHAERRALHDAEDERREMILRPAPASRTMRAHDAACRSARGGGRAP